MKIIYKSRNIKSASNLLQYTARYWAELIEELESGGYEVDSADRHKPAQWISAYKDGNKYEIEVSKYYDGTYEIVKADLVGEIKTSCKSKKQAIKSADSLVRSSYKISSSVHLGDEVEWNNQKYIVIDDQNGLRLRPVDRFSSDDFDDMESGDSFDDVYLDEYQLNRIESTTTPIVSANDVGYESYRDPRLELPEFDAFELDDIKATIELTLSKVTIEVNNDGSWDYDDESYPWVTETTLSEDYEFDLEVTTIVEDFDRIVEPYLPMDPGKYQISCDASLVYVIYGIYDIGNGQIDTSDAYVDFLPKESSIYNFKYSQEI